MAEERAQTSFSIMGAMLAVDFAALIGDGTVSIGQHKYRLRLDAPDEPSTGGGARARQHVKLVPDDKNGTVIILATVDPVERSVEVRTHEYIEEHYRKRFADGRFPLAEAQHEELMKMVLPFFVGRGLALLTKHVEKEAPPAAPPPPTLSTARAAIGVGASLFLIVLLVLLLK